MQFFNFHNELAYMDADHHDELGFANYACFCCAQPPEIGADDQPVVFYYPFVGWKDD